MPIITHALLYFGYALVSFAVGLALQSIGGETAGSAFLGGIALFASCSVTHAGIAASFAAGRVGGAEKRMKGEMERLKNAHREVLADIDAVQARLDQIETAQAFGTPRQIEAPAPQIPAQPEIKMIEQIVDR